jgi:hypothetical protein
MSYTGAVTAVLEERATLAGVDAETRKALEYAAEAYRSAPDTLKAAIIAAADKGDTPAKIARAIGYVYTYDYVARLIREHRKAAGS